MTAPEAAASVPPQAPDGRPHRVLIVDDVAENLKVIGNMLDGRGIDLCFATSGPQALASARAAPPDLVLLDVAMPEMDGYEVARRFKASEDLRSIPIIFITARTRTEDLVEGFRSGAVDYVTKPFVSAELIARVTAHLELKRAQDVIAGQLAVLRDLNAAKDRFLSIVAHDLRNPLHGISSLTELLLDLGEGLPAEKRLGYLRSINTTALQMAKTLSDLMSWARVQRGAFEWKPEPFELCFIVKEAAVLLESSAETKGVSIRNQVESDHHVFGDPIITLTIVRNLLSNAVKYSRRGGQVTVSATRVGDTSVRVSVTDTGIGMSPAQVSRLFRLETHSSRPGTDGERGTGFGLLFCQELLTKNGSGLEVESREEAGSTFAFTLPLAVGTEGDFRSCSDVP